MKEMMIRYKIKITCFSTIVIVLSLLLSQGTVFLASAAGSTYYVSTSGSDNNPGTFSSPWRTIQKAANVVTAGDTVYIRGGTYREKITLMNKQGTSSAWITFKPYNSEYVVVDGSTVSGTYDGIFLFKDGCKYIRVTDLEIRGTDNHGIFLYGGEIDHIRIDHCVIHDCESSGIYCYSADQPTKYVRNIEFDYNTVYDVNNGLSYSTSYSPQEAISFSNVQGFNIHHNSLSQYGKEGIDVKSGSSSGSIHHNVIDTSLASPAFQWDYNHIGIYVDGYNRKNHDISIYCNTIKGYGGLGIALGAESVGGSIEDISIYNNIISLSSSSTNTDFRGIDSFNDCPWKDVSIYSNTIYNYGSDNSPIRIFPSASHISNLVIANNIISGTAYTLLAFQLLKSTEVSGRVTLRNNLYYRYGGTGHNLWKDGTDKSWGSNYIINDPKFMDRYDYDLHLQISSPALDAGSMTYAPSTDFDGVTRPQGSYVEIGAYEYYTTSPDTTPPVITNIQLQTSPQVDIIIGWEIITCIATDNIAIHEVHIVFTDSNQNTITLPMTNIIGTSIYYKNTSLQQSSNYSYYIIAEDTNSNQATSTETTFSLPPNWDINNDGICSLFDNVLISNKYGQTGAPGWLREDVDNNGEINIIDITLVSNYYYEIWWK